VGEGGGGGALVSAKGGGAVKGYVPSVFLFISSIHFSDTHNSMIINPNTIHEY